MTTILSLLATVLIPVLKWVLERKEKRKLNDKDFVTYIEKHQEMRSRAGQTAIDWRASVKKMRAKRDEYLKKMSSMAKKKTDESTTKEK